MHLNIPEKKARLEVEVASLERRLQEARANVESLEADLNKARGGLAVLAELETEQASAPSRRNTEHLLQIPAVRLGDAVGKATTALQKFTRDDLEQWIRSNYPQLQFSSKSIDGPLQELRADGAVVMLRRNTGNKVQAIYGVKGTSAG